MLSIASETAQIKPIAAPQSSGTLDWSAQQSAALGAVAAWLKAPGNKQWFYLGGFAGTGKTTLAKHFAQEINGEVFFAAYTGKAALVMRSKGCNGASTIHSLIYKPKDEKQFYADGEAYTQPVFEINPESEAAAADLIIIDECSMVGDTLAKDLLSFGRPVLVIGDPAQLPPVADEGGKSAGFFTKGEPDFMLTEIHRQARDNPIIALSMAVREGQTLQAGTYGTSTIISSKKEDQLERMLKADQVLIGLNKTRAAVNIRFRKRLGFSGPVPMVGERLICLKNNHKRGLLNGQLFRVEEIKHNSGYNPVRLLLNDEDSGTEVETLAHVDMFKNDGKPKKEWEKYKGFDQFDYGYALTVHKAQGSQWDDVFLYDESGVFKEDKARWLYTGITRAAERITIAI